MIQHQPYSVMTMVPEDSPMSYITVIKRQHYRVIKRQYYKVRPRAGSC